jgi:phosphoglucosamine mutase
MEVIIQNKTKLSDLIKEVQIYPQILENVRVNNKKTAREDIEIVNAVAKVTEELGDNGRILVRESGTEPVLRVMVEAPTTKDCEKYVNMVVDKLKSQGHVIEK